MENKDVKSGSEIPEVSEEERKNRKTTKRLSKEWYCNVCNNGKNYTMAGKSGHLKTKKHIKNNDNSDITLDDIIRKKSLQYLINDILML